MKKRLRPALGLTSVLLIAGSLSAQEVRFGLQGSVAFPTSDLGDKGYLDNALGYGLGAHAVIGFTGGHAVVPRLDYTYFEKSSPTRKVQMLLVGADYNYYFSGKVNQGPYVGAGVGFGLAKFEMNLPTGSDNDTPNNAYGAVSAGYMFTRNIGAEVRCIYTKYKPELFGTKPEITSPTINATFIYRFN